MSVHEIRVPTFETDRLVLSPVTLDDVDAYERHFVDYEVIRFLSAQVPWPYPEGGVETFLREHVLPRQGDDDWMWGIRLAANPSALIGVVHLWREGRPEHRGFWLGREYWGRGFMTEAVKPVMDYAFESLGFEALVFTNAAGNIGSRRIKEKTGARLVAVEAAEFVDPAFTTHEIWRLTRADWRRVRDGADLG